MTKSHTFHLLVIDKRHELQKQGGPPTPEQTAQMIKLRARVGSFGRGGLILLTITLLAMATAGEVPF